MIKKMLMCITLLTLANINLYSMDKGWGIYLKTLDEEHLKIIANVNPWHLLGLQEGATQEEINKAYRNLSRAFHTDRSGFDSKYIFGNLNLAYNNALGKKIKDVDKYVVFKKLYEVSKKTEDELTCFDRYITNLMTINGISPEELKSDKFNDYDDMANFLNKNEKKLNILASTINYYQREVNGYSKLCLPSSMILDFIHSLNELYQISVLGSHDESDIRGAAKIKKMMHVFSALKMPWNLLIIMAREIQAGFSDYLNLECDFVPMNKGVRLARLCEILPGLSAFKFMRQDSQLNKDASKIAQYNKATNRDLRLTKLTQLAWLGINKVAPYAGLVLKNKYYGNKHSSKKLFDFRGDDNLDDNFYGQVFNTCKVISDISEIVRKHYRYKAEMGDYVNYFKNKTDNN